MQLLEHGSIGYNFITEGDGVAIINVFDHPDDSLVEDGDAFNDAQLTLTGFRPDMDVAGTAFQFDLGTDANVTIEGLEIFIREDINAVVQGQTTSTNLIQRGFRFIGVEGDETNINITNNTLMFQDIQGLINPNTQEILGIENDLRVVEFEFISGNASLSSSISNNVFYFNGASAARLFAPFYLFEPQGGNPRIDGQFLFNDVAVP